MKRTRTRDAGHFHAVKFYDTPESLCRLVADFLGEGLIAGQPAVVIATPSHRAGILVGLRARQFDIDGLEAAGHLVLLDASETLADFMVDGMPDADLFNTVATSALEGVSRGRQGRTIRAYGEMVDVLWRDGHEAAAIRLEMLWNTLAMTRDFSLLCGYAMGSFYKDTGLAAIHHQHSHVISGDGSATSRASVDLLRTTRQQFRAVR